ncbi:unnamed protein product [Schistosoma curassoni]|nr:unnamed protein product [Schistosoma curassoni]
MTELRKAVKSGGETDPSSAAFVQVIITLRIGGLVFVC